MAATTTNMALTIWDLLTDTFSHTTLANNFTAIDAHDHTSGKGVKVPQGGLANNSVGTAQLIDGNITTAKLGSSSVTDTQYTNANNSVFRYVFSGSYVLALSSGVGINWFNDNGGTTGSGDPADNPAAGLYYKATDYAVSGKTARFKLSGFYTINGTAPAATLTFGLYPLASNGGAADSTSITLGTVVPSSTVAVASPTANSSAGVQSSTFTIPSDGVYIFGVSIGATLPAGSMVGGSMRLLVNHT